MRIALLNPPWYVYDDSRGHLHGVRAGCRWPSLGPGGGPHLNMMRNNIYMPYPFVMGYTASLLEQYGHDVMFYDAICECDDMQTFYLKVMNFKPDVAIVETSSASITHDLGICDMLAEYGIRVALVGPHATAYAADMIKHPSVTWVLTQEYDDQAVELANGLLAEQTVCSGPLPDDLDARPFPVLELPQAHFYQDHYGFDWFERPQVQIWTTRGCPYSCSFCLWRHTMYDDDGKGSYRQRSAGNVLSEVDHRYEVLNFRHFLFDDDTFSVVGREGTGSRGYDRVVGIAEGMKERGYEWSYMTRLDCHSLNLFEYMRDCGAVALKVGAETFSDKTLHGIEKRMTGEAQLDRIKALVELGYGVYLATTSYIPGETEDDRKRNTDILEELAQIGVKWQRPHMTPLPGTPLFRQFQAAGYFADPDWSLFDGGAGLLHDVIEDYNRNAGAGDFDADSAEAAHWEGANR